ncbi:transcriptional regulator [Streptomyces sp. NPDC028722]|uniref:transcriptional regulator n=1 Tax=Streptomyces sp. NPDC028722 TaxID=3155016 RepID=UPI0033DCAA6D
MAQQPAAAVPREFLGQARYPSRWEDHLRRLRLVRALIQIGGVPVAAAREVIAAAEDESLDHHLRLGGGDPGAALRRGPAGDDPAVETARRSVETLLERLGCSCGPALDLLDPAHRRLVDSVAALVRLGHPCDTEHLLPYGRLAAQLAVTDLDMIEEQPTATGQIEGAVALTVPYAPVLLSLRRMARRSRPGGSEAPGTRGSPTARRDRTPAPAVPRTPPGRG